jgi:small subunit ribosomal protein S16
MATVIRLQRGGRKKRPFYSVVVMDSRNRRDGAFIEKLGYFDPCREPDVIELDLARVKAWTDKGAQVSPRVASLIKRVENPELIEKEKARAEAKAAAKAEAAAKAAEEAAKAEEEAKAAEAEDASASVEETAEAESAEAEATAEEGEGEEQADA